MFGLGSAEMNAELLLFFQAFCLFSARPCRFLRFRGLVTKNVLYVALQRRVSCEYCTEHFRAVFEITI